jgi:hypothetical protein
LDEIDVYLVPYHSFPPTSRIAAASGRFACVERAIAAGEWPYDNGDDPSFYAARHDDGLLTWGVCRQDLRNKIRPGSICVFFAFTKDRGTTRYRTSAVATVSDKLDRRSVFQDTRFHGKNYINILIRPDGNGWVYDETDRHKGDRHTDWLWRIAAHRATGQQEFDERNTGIRTTGRFTDDDVKIATNYVVFSDRADETYISPNPPLAAIAENGVHETWVSENLKRLTVDVAARLHPGQRNFLRSTGSGYVHRQLTFRLPTDRAVAWRQSLMTALHQETAARTT